MGHHVSLPGADRPNVGGRHGARSAHGRCGRVIGFRCRVRTGPTWAGATVRARPTAGVVGSSAFAAGCGPVHRGRRPRCGLGQPARHRRSRHHFRGRARTGPSWAQPRSAPCQPPGHAARAITLSRAGCGPAQRGRGPGASSASPAASPLGSSAFAAGCGPAHRRQTSPSMRCPGTGGCHPGGLSPTLGKLRMNMPHAPLPPPQAPPEPSIRRREWGGWVLCGRWEWWDCWVLVAHEACGTNGFSGATGLGGGAGPCDRAPAGRRAGRGRGARGDPLRNFPKVGASPPPAKLSWPMRPVGRMGSAGPPGLTRRAGPCDRPPAGRRAGRGRGARGRSASQLSRSRCQTTQTPRAASAAATTPTRRTAGWSRRSASAPPDRTRPRSL